MSKLIFELTPCIRVLARLFNQSHQVDLHAKVLALHGYRDLAGVGALAGFSQLRAPRYV